MDDPNEKYESMYKVYTRDQERVKEAWDLIDKILPYLRLHTTTDSITVNDVAKALLAEVEEKRKLHE